MFRQRTRSPPPQKLQHDEFLPRLPGVPAHAVQQERRVPYMERISFGRRRQREPGPSATRLPRLLPPTIQVHAAFLFHTGCLIGSSVPLNRRTFHAR